MERRGEAPDHFDDGAWIPTCEGLAVTDSDELSREWHASLIKNDDHDDFSRVVRTARRLFEAANDHLLAIAVLVQTEGTVRAPLALTRVALDAAAHLHHLFDPNIPASQRLIRALNEDLVVLSESVRDAERSGLSRPTDEEVAIDSLLAEVTQAAPSIHASWPASQGPAGSKLGRVPFIDKFVGPSDMVDAALEAAGGSMWAGLSAVVHNQESQTFRVMFSLELSKNMRYREMNIALRVLAAAVVLARAIRRLGTYMGWDVTDAADDELLRLWSIGAGLADDQIREQVLRERTDP